MYLRIYRGSAVNEKFRIDDRTLFVQKVLGQNYVRAAVNTREPLDLAIGDYIRYNGVQYYINTEPEVRKAGTNKFETTIVFESMYYDMGKIQYRYTDQGDFFLQTDADGFVDLLVSNLNRIDSGWTKGSCTQTNTEYKLMRFASVSCREAIQNISDAFRGEFSFNRKEISFSDEKENPTALTFEYKAGLKNIEKTPIEAGNLITRLYALGSSRNLGSAYGKLRLELNTAGVDYIESNTATYGTIEGTEIFDDVFPRRQGTVSSISSDTEFTDNAIDFDVISYLIDGVTAKVNFLTGDCAGYTFDITTFAYSGPGGAFEIIPIVLQDGTVMPNVTLNPAAGDKYVVLDITMPASYITAAEAELLTLAQAHLAKYDHPRVAYRLTPDWRYMKEYGVNLTIGDTITITDTDLGISSTPRIVALTQQLIEPYKYMLSVTDQIDDTVSNTAQISMMAYKVANIGAGKIASSKPVDDLSLARRNWRTTQELESMVFDTEGDYYSSKIKPLSIETTMLAAGAKSRDFELNNIILEPNYGSSNNAFYASGGTLTHFNIDDSEEDNIGTWTVQECTTYAAGGMTTGTSYYLYAKCDKDNYADAGNAIIISTSAYQVDQGDDWYFLIGILYGTTGSEPRKMSFSYGQTYINGGFITTGTIDASVVNVDNINADNIVTGTLTGRTVQTASSGQRIVLSQADNTFRMHTATETDVIVIDDNVWATLPGIVITNTSGAVMHIKDGSSESRLTTEGLAISSTSNYQFDITRNLTAGSGPMVYLTKLKTGDGGDYLLCRRNNGAGWDDEFKVDNNGDVTAAGTLDVDGATELNNHLQINHAAMQIRRTENIAYGPTFDSYHSRGSTVAGQDGDQIFASRHYGYDDSSPTPQPTQFTEIQHIADDVSNGTEDGSINHQVMAAGALTTITTTNAAGFDVVSGGYKIGGTVGINFSGYPASNITVVGGIVTNMS